MQSALAQQECAVSANAQERKKPPLSPESFLPALIAPSRIALLTFHLGFAFCLFGPGRVITAQAGLLKSPQGVRACVCVSCIVCAPLRPAWLRQVAGSPCELSLRGCQAGQRNKSCPAFGFFYVMLPSCCVALYIMLQFHLER